MAANLRLSQTTTTALAPGSKTGYAGVIEAKPGKPKPYQARSVLQGAEEAASTARAFRDCRGGSSCTGQGYARCRDGVTWAAPTAARAARGTGRRSGLEVERTQRPRIKRSGTTGRRSRRSRSALASDVATTRTPTSKEAARTNAPQPWRNRKGFMDDISYPARTPRGSLPGPWQRYTCVEVQSRC